MAPCFKYMKTPQTDDLARGNHVVPTEWAEQLESERDEAREEARLLKGILDLLKKDAFCLSQLSDCIEDDTQ